MKIIDPTTGKRLDGLDKQSAAAVAKRDPVKRMVEKDLETLEHSPMDPPDAYSVPEELREVQPEKFHRMLNDLIEDHKTCMEQLEKFEKSLMALRTNNYQLTEENNTALSAWFTYLEEDLLPHNRREERRLFPLLHQRLIEAGEHSKSEPKTTAVDLFEDDHVKMIQLGTLSFNLLGLGVRLRDRVSCLQVMDVAVSTGMELIELIRLHIFREDHTLFPLAVKLLSQQEFDTLVAQH